MNTARIVVLTIAIGAGGIAAYLASGSDKPAEPAAPVAQLPTVDVLIAKSDIGLGQTVKPEDLQWQTWPAATASNTFIRRTDKAEAIKDVAGSIARAPFIAGEPIREQKLVRADGSVPVLSNRAIQLLGLPPRLLAGRRNVPVALIGAGAAFAVLRRWVRSNIDGRERRAQAAIADNTKCPSRSGVTVSGNTPD